MSQDTIGQTSAVTHAIEPVIPGRYAVVTVGGADAQTPVYAIPIFDAPRGTPGAPASSASPADPLPTVVSGPALALAVADRREECLVLDMPEGPLTLVALQTTPGLDLRTAWLGNRARVNWTYPQFPAPGASVRILGRNLVRPDLYRSADPARLDSQARVMDVASISPADSRPTCVLRSDNRPDVIDVPVLRASLYEAHIQLPATLAPGAYRLYIHNGLGGPAGWSEPATIQVVESAWPATTYRIDDYLARGLSVDDAFSTALRDIERGGGGVLLLSARTYPITRTLEVGRYTVIRGAGRDRTLLRLPFLSGAAVQPFVAVTGDGDFALEDLSLRSGYAPLLVCAPKFVAQTADEAAFSNQSIGLSDRRARNVAIRRCTLEQHPFHQTMRRKDFDPRGWMKDFSERGWAAMSKNERFACVYFKGDGLEVEGSTILGGGHAIDLDRATYARISGNVLKAGFFGLAVQGFTRLTWPAADAPQVGARIAGNEVARIILEDNDISARSEFARNLVSFYFGGDELFLARNFLHDIAPNCDSEALMTHLWQARWCNQKIRMRGPTSGELLDPTGEVTHENLDGAWVDVVQGRGMGQVRRIVRRAGAQIELESPWRVAPDETSVVAITAPSLFRNLMMLDNRVESEAVNIIVYGSVYDGVVEGNYTADGPGITVWSVRLAADQKVWGGSTFLLVCNNTMDRGYSSPVRQQDALDGAVGFFVRCSKHHAGPTVGYDVLGLIVRDNFATQNTGIGMQVTFKDGVAGKAPEPWTIRHAGIVLEKNLITHSVVGVAVEEGAAVVVRGNECRDVTWPMSWVPAK